MRWLEKAIDFAEFARLDYDLVEAAAMHPDVVQPDPYSRVVGYPVRRHRRGDLEAVIGYRDPDDPTIIFVRLIMPGDPRRGSIRGAGSQSGSSLPSTLRDLRGRIVRAGYRLDPGTKHDKVRADDGTVLLTIPGTPSDHRSIPNAYRKFLARDAAYRNGLLYAPAA